MHMIQNGFQCSLFTARIKLSTLNPMSLCFHWNAWHNSEFLRVIQNITFIFYGLGIWPPMLELDWYLRCQYLWASFNTQNPSTQNTTFGTVPKISREHMAEQANPQVAGITEAGVKNNAFDPSRVDTCRFTPTESIRHTLYVSDMRGLSYKLTSLTLCIKTSNANWPIFKDFMSL